MKSILLTLATLSFVTLFSFTNINAQSDPYSGAVDAKLLSAPAPEYPDAAKKTGIGGKVTLLVALDAEGKVTGVNSVSGPDSVCPTITSPPIVALRDASRAAALKAKFAPATRDGKPVESMMRISYDFKGTRRNDGGLAAKGNKNDAAKADSSKDNYTIQGKSVKGEPTAETASTNNRAGGDQTVYKAPAVTSPKGDYMNMPKTISGGVLNGTAMALAKPPYPPAARAVRASGSVQIQVLIDTNGYVYSADAVSGHPLLQSASRIAACNSRFQPTLLAGHPVKVGGIITYNFVP